MKATAILLPADNRPITYLFPELICQLANLSVSIAPRDLMGSLTAPTDIDALFQWLKDTACQISDGVMFICLDSLLYGGLIPSRRSSDSLETIQSRLAQIADLKKLSGGNLQIYAQSSIMRISDNYDNSEEKQYWSEYGREIFRWSELLHKREIGLPTSEGDLLAVQSLIKDHIREDYLATRNRNFAINQKIIDYIVTGDLDYLIFSQDDSGQYGLNVLEKNKLIEEANKKHLHNIRAYAGADEVLITLIARYLNNQRNRPAKISVHYSSSSGYHIASNFEGQTIGRSVECQTEAQGLEIIDSDIADNGADFTVIIHTGVDVQGDHVRIPGLKDLSSIDTSSTAKKVIELIEKAKVPVVLCDVAYSNGADPLLIDLLLARPQLFKRIWSYAGWNTTGNTIGSALSVGTTCLHAISTTSHFDQQLHKKILFLRLMDDWAYQTQVRQKIQMDKPESVIEEILNRLMSEYSGRVSRALNFEPGTMTFSLPWHRTFEIEINLNRQFIKAKP